MPDNNQNIFSPCEPFHAYNRIEARPRQEELDHALSATIHDPLWMLARQFQFGEFKGEDAGSAIFAKVALNKVRMTEFKNGNLPAVPIDDSRPLETTVEAILPEFDYKMALRFGKKFLEIMNKHGDAGLPQILYAPNQYKNALCAYFAFQIEEVADGDTPGQMAAKLRTKSLSNANSFVRALAGRAINGAAIWKFLNGNAAKMNQLVAALNVSPTETKFINHEHGPMAVATAQEWMDYVKVELNLPENDQTDCWHPSKLEYAFDTLVDEGNNSKTKIGAEEYYNGSLDWYAFDVRNEASGGTKVFDSNIRKREVLTVIPSEASFAGMPNSRWWQMEDGTIDLGNLKASDTDIAKIVVAQYALQYSTDWLSIPYDLDSGSFVEVEGIVVTDTFGSKSFVAAAHKEGEDWNEWNMYSLSVQKGEFATPEFDKRMLLPPSAAKVYEGKPIEEVKMIRDEMANMVWGIESVVPDGLGGGINGYEVAEKMASLFAELAEQQDELDEIELPQNLDAILGKANTYKPQLKYMLGNSVTENWIPFIASHLAGSNREINFQRASMPRIIDGIAPHAIRPCTPLLRIGVSDEDAQNEPYFIDEEEVPRSGVMIRGNFQRTRWYNGKIVTWYGRRKRTCRGEGSSGLRFDLVLDNKR